MSEKEIKNIERTRRKARAYTRKSMLKKLKTFK
jgi:hypothetical protein